MEGRERQGCEGWLLSQDRAAVAFWLSAPFSSCGQGLPALLHLAQQGGQGCPGVRGQVRNRACSCGFPTLPTAVRCGPPLCLQTARFKHFPRALEHCFGCQRARAKSGGRNPAAEPGPSPGRDISKAEGTQAKADEGPEGLRQARGRWFSGITSASRHRKCASW